MQNLVVICYTAWVRSPLRGRWAPLLEIGVVSDPLETRARVLPCQIQSF